MRSNNHIELRVEDDGRGFDPANVPTTDGTQHLGLQSMAERAKGLDGSFNICSKPKEGTVITVKVPYNRTYQVEAA